MTGPYLLAAKAAIVLAILAIPTCAGYRMGKANGIDSQQPKIVALTKSNDILKAGLANAGLALREVSAKAHQEAAKAKQQQAQGAIAVTEAKQAAKDSKARVSKLEETLRRERSTCTEAEVKICGVQLR